MVKCSFCGTVIPKGTGKMFVRRDATTFFFCSNKCEENQLKLGRAPAKTKWTLAYRTGKAQAVRTKEKKTGKGNRKSGKQKTEGS